MEVSTEGGTVKERFVCSFNLSACETNKLLHSNFVIRVFILFLCDWSRGKVIRTSHNCSRLYVIIVL